MRARPGLGAHESIRAWMLALAFDDADWVDDGAALSRLQRQLAREPSCRRNFPRACWTPALLLQEEEHVSVAAGEAVVWMTRELIRQQWKVALQKSRASWWLKAPGSTPSSTAFIAWSHSLARCTPAPLRRMSPVALPVASLSLSSPCHCDYALHPSPTSVQVHRILVWSALRVPACSPCGSLRNLAGGGWEKRSTRWHVRCLSQKTLRLHI